MSMSIYGRGAYQVFIQNLADDFHGDRENFHPDDIPVPWEFLPDYERRAWEKVGALAREGQSVDCGGDEKSRESFRSFRIAETMP